MFFSDQRVDAAPHAQSGPGPSPGLTSGSRGAIATRWLVPHERRQECASLLAALRLVAGLDDQFGHHQLPKPEKEAFRGQNIHAVDTSGVLYDDVSPND